jgi:hypothetical protein
MLWLLGTSVFGLAYGCLAYLLWAAWVILSKSSNDLAFSQGYLLGSITFAWFTHVFVILVLLMALPTLRFRLLAYIEGGTAVLTLAIQAGLLFSLQEDQLVWLTDEATVALVTVSVCIVAMWGYFRLPAWSRGTRTGHAV